MNEIYRPIIDGLCSRAICNYFYGEEQLIVSRQRGPVLPANGNSFWVSHRQGTWFLCTWAPSCYRLPPEADLVALCEAFLDYGSVAQSEVPLKLVDRFQLTKLSDQESEAVFV